MVLAAGLSLVSWGCGGSEANDIDDDPNLGVGKATMMTRDDEGNLVSRADANQDGESDVWKYFNEAPDPNDPAVTLTRLVRKEVDVNFDGKVDMIRNYNELGELTTEKIDVDLDGSFDYVNQLDNGKLVRREVLGVDGKTVASRYYADGEILRVEKDRDGDSNIDYWEFYEQGILDRIGQDLNGDGRADTWQTR